MAYALSNSHVTDDVTWPWKVKLVTPIHLECNISQTAGFRDSVPKDHNGNWHMDYRIVTWGSTVVYTSDSLASCLWCHCQVCDASLQRLSRDTHCPVTHISAQLWFPSSTSLYPPRFWKFWHRQVTLASPQTPGRPPNAQNPCSASLHTGSLSLGIDSLQSLLRLLLVARTRQIISLTLCRNSL